MLHKSPIHQSMSLMYVAMYVAPLSLYVDDSAAQPSLVLRTSAPHAGISKLCSVQNTTRTLTAGVALFYALHAMPSTPCATAGCGAWRKSLNRKRSGAGTLCRLTFSYCSISLPLLYR